MAKLSPVTRQELIKGLRTFGFEGPYQGGKRAYMIKGETRLTIPNPHRKEVSVDLLGRILRQAGISRDDWLDE